MPDVISVRDAEKKFVAAFQDELWKGIVTNYRENMYLRHLLGIFQVAVMTSHPIDGELEDWKQWLRNFGFHNTVLKYALSDFRFGKNLVIKPKKKQGDEEQAEEVQTESTKSNNAYRRDLFDVYSDHHERMPGCGISILRKEVIIHFKKLNYPSFSIT